jgi:lipoprotein-releasing system permease protein
LPDYQVTATKLRQRVKEITELTPFVQREAILRTASGVAGVMLKGLPTEDTSTLARQRVTSGVDLAFAHDDTLPPLLISQGLAKDLKTGVGKSIAAIRFNERMKSREDIISSIKKFRVVGIFQTGMTEYDNSHAYTLLPAAQDFNGFSRTQVTGYSVKTTDLTKARATAERINEVLKYPYYAQSVYDLYQTIFAWIDLQKKPIPIVLGLIIIVATFNIISTLLLIVIEKTHSIGVLKSLGATSKGVARIFIAEGMVIAALGSLFGCMIGFAISWLQLTYHFFRLRSEIYFMSSVPISIEWQHYAIVCSIAMLLALSATLIPARIAARMKPLHALNFG